MYESVRLWLRQLLFLCQKELLATLKDPRNLAILALPAIIQGFLYGYAATYDLDEVPYAVVDMSHSRTSAEILAHMDGTGAFAREVTLTTPKQIDEYINSGQVLLAVVFPQDLEDNVTRAAPASIQVITDGKNPLIATKALSYISAIVDTVNREQLSIGSPATIITRTWYNENQLSRWNFLPALVGMISFTQIIMLSGLSIAKEKELGTFDQLLVTPLSSAQILIGKSLPPMLIGFVQSTLILMIGVFYFDVPFRGSLVLLYLSLFFFMISSIGIGLSISSISQNMQQVLVYIMVFLMPMVLLSGMATPIDNMPKALQILTYADPMRFAIDSIRRIYLEGADFSLIWTNFIPLAIIAMITLPLAAWLFKNNT